MQFPELPVPVLDDHFDLADVAAGLGHPGIHAQLPDGQRRRWTYLVETPAYEAVVIGWPPGAGLRMHGHDGSRAAIHIVAGQLRERFVDVDGSVRMRWLDTGSTTRLDADHVHEVLNIGDVEAVSVHVYAPPLADTSFRIDQEIDLASEVGRVEIAGEVLQSGIRLHGDDAVTGAELGREAERGGDVRATRRS